MPRAKSSKEQTVHVGIEYTKALDAKKAVLLTEKSLLELIKIIRNYRDLRKKEFILKNRIRKTFGSLKTDISDIEEKLPEPEYPKFKKETSNIESFENNDEKSELEKIERFRLSSVTKEKNRELELELEDIKAKLDRLG